MTYSSFHMGVHTWTFTHMTIYTTDSCAHASTHAVSSDSCLILRSSVSPYQIRKRDQFLSSSLHSLLSEQRGEAIALGLKLSGRPLDVAVMCPPCFLRLWLGSMEGSSFVISQSDVKPLGLGGPPNIFTLKSLVHVTRVTLVILELLLRMN